MVGNANTWKHDDDNSLGKSFKKATTKQPKVNVKVSYLVYETNEDSCEGSEGKVIYLISKLNKQNYSHLQKFLDLSYMSFRLAVHNDSRNNIGNSSTYISEERIPASWKG